MVATISARQNIAAARRYYSHLKKDDYYCAATPLNSSWVGRAAKILALDGHVSQTDFAKVLSGCCPQSGTALVQCGRNHKKHVPGWDLTLSAPKSVSILWALAPTPELRTAIENTHKAASRLTAQYIEDRYAWCRRGKGGRVKEKTAGLLAAAFTHYTSRNLDPQLHDHLFIMNVSPRKDGTWGAIQSKPLYDAQKQIGAFYRQQLAQELRAINVPAIVNGETIVVDGISREQEMAFSSRRRDILKAVEAFNYAKNARGLEKAALRSRKAKESADLQALHSIWSDRADAMQRGLLPLYKNMPGTARNEQPDNAVVRISIPQERLRWLTEASAFILQRLPAQDRLNQKLKAAAHNLLKLLRGARSFAKSVTKPHRPSRRHR